MTITLKQTLSIICCFLFSIVIFSSCSTKYHSGQSLGYFEPINEAVENDKPVTPEKVVSIIEEIEEEVKLPKETATQLATFKEALQSDKPIKALKEVNIPELIAAAPQQVENNRFYRLIERRIINKIDKNMNQGGGIAATLQSLLYLGLLFIIIGLVVGLIFNQLGFILTFVGVILLLLHLLQVVA